MDKEKLSKILLIASLALILVAFCTTFAPAFNLKYTNKETGTLLGTGTIASMFTLLFCFLKSTYVIKVDATGEIIQSSRKAVSTKSLPYAISMAALITILLIIAIVVLVLFLTKKYQGKMKLVFSIATWTLLLVTVVVAFLLKEIINVRDPSFKEIQAAASEDSLAAGPILYGVFGILSLGTSVTSFILNRE